MRPDSFPKVNDVMLAEAIRQLLPLAERSAKEIKRRRMATIFLPNLLKMGSRIAGRRLTRLRGFAGFSVRHPLRINGLAGKVCTTTDGE
jgi:hypothetical protein